RPRIDEDDLDVEDDEDHRHQVEAHREALGRLTVGDDAALVGGELGGRGPAGRQQAGGQEREAGEDGGQDEHQGERQVLIHQVLATSWRLARASLSRRCSVQTSRTNSVPHDTAITAAGWRRAPRSRTISTDTTGADVSARALRGGWPARAPCLTT